VPGVVGVALGGSRARDTHRPDSDWDLGVYYRPPLDLAGLRAVVGDHGSLTEPGGWGPWVDGGGWLRYGDAQVDVIYRDWERVQRVWADCREGRYEVGFQVGHPLGFYSHAYAGEVAHSRVLADTSGALAALRAQTQAYPPALGAALVAGAWEAGFLLDNAAKPAGDPVYVAGCLFRAVGVLVHALHGRAGVWLVNEKGMVTSAGRLPGAPTGFAADAAALLAAPMGSPAQVTSVLGAARRLLARALA
jgi:hypothetical protein